MKVKLVFVSQKNIILSLDYDFSQMDSYALEVGNNLRNVELLVTELIDPFDEKIEFARVLFRWIAE